MNKPISLMLYYAKFPLSLLLVFSLNLNINAQCLEVIGYNGDNPDEILVQANGNIPAGACFWLTDNEWDSASETMTTTENEIKWEAPAGGVADGETILFTSGAVTCGTVTGDNILLLSTSGDEIFITTVDVAGTVTDADICFALIGDSSSSSDLPTNGVNLGETDNSAYSGAGDIFDEANWNNSNSIITLPAATCMTALPVELRDFTGKYTRGSIELQWITLSEINNDKFVIEYALNGTDFRDIGTEKGFGTTSSESAYSFTHNTPSESINYYRLKQIDLDGSSSFSEIIAIESGERAQIKVYPTIVSDYLQVEGVKSGTAKIYNAYGQVFETFMMQEQTSIPLDSYQSGIYFLNINDETFRFIVK